MTENMLSDLMELVEAKITDMNSDHIEDRVRYHELYNDFVNCHTTEENFTTGE
jgi:hypothetical protein